MKTVVRLHNGGKWTPSRFHSFIKGGLRSISNRWPPKFETLKEARTGRGEYLCAGYNKKAHKVSLTVNRKRNVFVDHIAPVVDPVEGFTTWDNLIERLFCEKDGFQVLCGECHSNKTKDERVIRKKKNG